MSMTGDTTQGAQGFGGQQGLADQSSEFSILAFMIRQALGAVRTVVPVKVIAVHPGQSMAPGTVDVQALVNQVDGLGNATPHGTVFGLPFVRLTAGTFAIVMDPVVGDLGLMLVADRDISSVKSTSKAANPSSRRKFSFSDGIYLGGILGAAPQQYIIFDPTNGFAFKDKIGNTFIMNQSGITLSDSHGNSIVTSSTGIVITDANGNIINMKSGSVAYTTPLITTNADITAGLGGADQIGVRTHKHSGVTPGGGSTQLPTAGT